MNIRHILAVPIAILMLLLGCLSPDRVSADPFIGEIRWVSFNFAPRNWALCNGQLLAINQYTALFSLLGTTYGGNGTTNFALPDMRSRAPIHVSPDYPLGTITGEENHVLITAEIPNHTHTVKADPKEGTSAGPAGNYPAKISDGTSVYGNSSGATLAPTAITNAGGVTGHNNMKPYITLNCIIATSGIFPSRN